MLVSLDLNDDIILSVDLNILQNFQVYDDIVFPDFLIKKPYRDILISIARGDSKLLHIFNKAHIGESLGKDIIYQLVELDILSILPSRESPIKINPKQKLKRELRSYKVQSIIRFKNPFYYFWFGFVEPYRIDIENSEYDRFWEYFLSHYHRCTSLVFEQLSSDIINYRFDIVSYGNYWDRKNEFDILSITTDKKTILGECKYKNKKICKNELNRLISKSIVSDINADYYALFSKNGYSNELKNLKTPNILLYDLSDFEILLEIN